MGILSSLFGGGKATKDDPAEQAAAFLDSLEEMLYRQDNWKNALKTYRRGARHDPFTGPGGPLEKRFSRLAFDLVTKERESEKSRTPAEPEAVRKVISETQAITWDEDLQSVEDLCSRVDFSDPGLAWITEPRAEKEVDPLNRARVFYSFALEPDLVIAFIGAGIPMVMRKSFLKQAAEDTLDADLQLEDLGQELLDYARSRKLAARYFAGR